MSSGYFVNLSRYKVAIWIYLALLIFEGALRKWLMPQFATPLLLVREPIVVWLVCVGFVRGWLHNRYVAVAMVVSTVSLIATLLTHGNILVGLYGWRAYFFHIPFLFIIGGVFNRDDVLMVGKVVICFSLPMTALVIWQFYSPQTAWVNIGVGGEGSSGFSGAMGYFRASGTFSFTSGYVAFQGLVGVLLCFYILANNTLMAWRRLPTWLIYVALGAYLVTIPISISRTHLFQTIVFLGFVVVALLFSPRRRWAFVGASLLGVLISVAVVASGVLDESMQAFMARLETANRIEGGVEGVIAGRYIGGLLDGLFNFDVPPVGYGLGVATNVGAKMLGIDIWRYFNGENEWCRITGECGVLLGWIIITLRLVVAFVLFRMAWFRMTRGDGDLLPWFLSAMMLLTFPQGQMGVPTNLGFAIFCAGLTMASLNRVER